MFYVVTDSEKNDSQETFVELSKILSVKKKHTEKRVAKLLLNLHLSKILLTDAKHMFQTPLKKVTKNKTDHF